MCHNPQNSNRICGTFSLFLSLTLPSSSVFYTSLSSCPVRKVLVYWYSNWYSLPTYTLVFISHVPLFFLFFLQYGPVFLETNFFPHELFFIIPDKIHDFKLSLFSVASLKIVVILNHFMHIKKTHTLFSWINILSFNLSSSPRTVTPVTYQKIQSYCIHTLLYQYRRLREQINHFCLCCQIMKVICILSFSHLLRIFYNIKFPADFNI